MSELTGALRETLHEKENIIAELEKLATAVNVDYQSEITRLTGAYEACGELPPEFAELLDKRFSDAVKSASAGESLFIARLRSMKLKRWKKRCRHWIRQVVCWQKSLR